MNTKRKLLLQSHDVFQIKEKLSINMILITDKTLKEWDIPESKYHISFLKIKEAIVELFNKMINDMASFFFSIHVKNLNF